MRNNGIKSAVVSASLGGPRSAALNDAVADLTNAGITVVVAAGGLGCTHACMAMCVCGCTRSCLRAAAAGELGGRLPSDGACEVAKCDSEP